MKRLFLLAALIPFAAAAQDNTKGYYKDIFMDSGIMLNSRTDLPVTEMLGLTMETFVSTPHSSTSPYKFTRADTLRQRELVTGSPMDENGILLYPDGAPRFRMIYMNGGKAAGHGRSLEETGRRNYRSFIKAGGSYLGSCAGAFAASLGSRNAEGKISNTATYIGLWPGHTMGTKLEKSYTAVDIVPNGPLTREFDFDGRMHIDSVRHNGGCFPWMETAPAGTEVLARYSTKGRELERDIDGLPVVWAWKEAENTGRVVLCGSHPEGAPDVENLALMSALVRYTLAGNGTPSLKAVLRPGHPRAMNDPTDPAFAPVGDRQYHHFAIDVPKGVQTMTVDLKGFLDRDDFDLHLFVSRTGFAYAGESTWAHVGYNVDKSLEIKDPKPGRYYISVFCATTVTATMGKYGVEYSGRTDVLNGVPYTLLVDFER
jgi:glutamine amidotransferase-like uncharacterized protein